MLNQTYGNLEVIISDNCCTDNTMRIVSGYSDPRIVIHRNSENIGLVGNFRKVLTYATGKYMMFLGSDDLIDLRAVEKCVAVLEDPSNQDIQLVNTFIRIINDESRVIATKKFIFGRGRISSWWAIRSTLFAGFNIIGEPNGSLFRRSAYEKIPEPKFRNGDRWTLDMDMKNELFLLGASYMIPEALGMFRISSQSNSNKNLRFEQAKLYRLYAWKVFRDKRYGLSFFWVITATINSLFAQIMRNLFYILFIKNK